MAAADVDVSYIAGHLGLGQPVVATLIAQPTVDLVSTLLQAVAAKAYEFESLYAEKLQTDIELENAVHSSETRSQSLKGTADKALKDLEETRQHLKEEETKRQSVENDLQALKVKYSDYDADVKALNDKIETFQSSNRTNLSIIESNNKRDQALSEELTKQHQRNVELSRKGAALQQSEQNAKGQLNSAKYLQEAIQQQLDLARQSAEWLENELKTKSEEAFKYRKEKGARITELQRQNEDAKTQVDALKRTEQQLRERLDAMQTKADDAHVKLQKQEGSFASTVESYKQELEDQRRLVGMSEQLSKKHQERVRQLEAEKGRLKDNYENELRRVRLELESERRVTMEMEERIRQLETELDEAQARMEHAPLAASAPQTPRHNGSLFGRAASPFGTPGSIRNKSVITATQAIEQLYQVKGQLASERRKNQQLGEELDGMIGALEAKTPEIQELQSEAETLRTEITHMSELSQQSFEERDAARKLARKFESAFATTKSENKILRTQLRDLSTQIQMLVFNIYAIEKGTDQLTEEEKFRLQQLEKGEITEEALSDLSDTHQFITQKLVVYKDIKSLQAKNEDLLRITRELAEQMESEEALAAKHKAKDDHDMAEKLQQDLTRMTEEIKSAKLTMESYKMERDMFRRLLQQRSVVGDEASLMRGSLDGRAPLVSIESREQTATVTEALRKLQSEYDSFRDAQESVRTDIRGQVDHLTAEKNSLQTTNIKLQGEAKLEFERREMLQSNYAALQKENGELQKRSQILSEAAAKQDIRTQQIVEELIEARGLIDSMRNETANLKAEKKLWKDIHERMTKDNDSLVEEKNRLGNLLTAQQTLENERNITESEARRKAQAKIESLEDELSNVQKKLSKAMEESQHLQQRKEFEAKESQKRIDDLMVNLSQIREEHIGTKTSKDHLQARVDELTAELRSAEERVGRLQPRPTPRPGLTDNSQRQQELEAEIQDLNNDVSDLKRDIDLANTHLENAKAQAEQYRELSQGNEEAFEELRASQDQYRQEIETIIQEKDAKIRELGQQIEDVSTELSRSNTELSALRDAQGEVARKYEDEKDILEEEVKRLKEESSRHIEAARYHQQDLRAQAEIASKAQQDYEKELVKHAEAAKLVQQLRNNLNELKSESASLQAEAESAKVTLAQSESSWEERRQHLEKEMAELKQRREDANAQNKLLHQQLESLPAQIATMQQARSDNADVNEAMSPIGVSDAIEGMRELNGYLRREKEILEVQYDMKTQESKRLQQQVEYLQSQLDDARLKLDQERLASQNGNTSMAHKDLMEKLNELNLYRESSMTLRSENNQLKDQILEKNMKIEDMAGKIQPLESEIDSLKTQKSFLEDEIKQIQEDRDRWQKRTEGILTKYGRVDPAEMEELKTTITDLETERNSLKEGEKPLKEEITELESTLETERSNWANLRAKLTEQFKDRSRKLTGERNEITQRANHLQEQLDKANNELVGAQKQAEQSSEEKLDFQRQIQQFQHQVEELRQQAQQAQQTQPAATAPAAQKVETSSSSEVATVLEQHLTDARKELEAVNAQKLGAEQQLERLRNELQEAISERDDALQKLQDAAIMAPLDGQPVPTGEAAETQTPTASTGLSGVDRQLLEEKIAATEQKAAEFEQKANEVEAKIQQTIKERSDRMRDALNNKLKESRSKLEEEYKKKDEDLRLRLQQEKLIWQAGNAKSALETEAPVMEQPPSTPVQAEGQPRLNTSATPVLSDMSQLDDTSIRQFLASNATVKSIISANIKKKLESESVRIKSEYEGRITSAREQSQLMESKKSSLRINMAEKKLKGAIAKLDVIETAATETPQKPVAEVWQVAKSAQAPPPPPPTQAAATATPAKQSSIASVPSTPAAPFTGATVGPAAVDNPKQAAAGASAQESKSAQAAVPSNGISAPKNNNPFVVPQTGSSDAPNPFAPKTEVSTGPTGQAAQPQQAQQPVQPQSQLQQQGQQQGQPAVRSSIPMPRGGGRGRGGAYVPPGQRSASGNQEAVGQGHAGRGGRGGARGGRGNMNPGAADFQPGTKRPRGDSEIGAGVKRARGAH